MFATSAGPGEISDLQVADPVKQYHRPVICSEIVSTNCGARRALERCCCQNTMSVPVTVYTLLLQRCTNACGIWGKRQTYIPGVILHEPSNDMVSTLSVSVPVCGVISECARLPLASRIWQNLLLLQCTRELHRASQEKQLQVRSLADLTARSLDL